jgi:hypothetical protein
VINDHAVISLDFDRVVAALRDVEPKFRNAPSLAACVAYSVRTSEARASLMFDDRDGWRDGNDARLRLDHVGEAPRLDLRRRVAFPGRGKEPAQIQEIGVRCLWRMALSWPQLRSIAVSQTRAPPRSSPRLPAQ